jgi:hypothetical protein
MDSHFVLTWTTFFRQEQEILPLPHPSGERGYRITTPSPGHCTLSFERPFLAFKLTPF